jgi:site-specific DNA-methyltransferase (adenine-specific)
MFYDSVKSWLDAGMPWDSFVRGDCNEAMREMPDKFAELAIVDPEYGIGRDGSKPSTSKHGGRKEYEFKGWDSKRPEKDYFNQLWRISKNQIIWGANYFSRYLPPSMGWIFWDKGQRICNSDGELAFTSFERALRVAEYNRVELLIEGAIHPTQKPIILYRWILKNYAKLGDKILDTHVGSASSLIACEWEGFQYLGFEKDEDYFRDACKRIEQWRASRTIDMFEEPKNGTAEQLTAL